MFSFKKGKQQFDPKKPLQVHKVVNLMADMIVKDIKDGITTHSKDIKDAPFKKLSPNTIASKRKKGQSDKPLLAEGKMKEVYVRTRAKVAKQTAVIGINKRDRGLVSGVHQEGTSGYTITPKNKPRLVFETAQGTVYAKQVNHPGVPKREWFGFSTRVKPKLVALVRKMLKKELRI